MKPYRATLRLLYDYDRALVEVIQFLDSHRHSNEPVRETVDTLLNHSDKLKNRLISSVNRLYFVYKSSIFFGNISLILLDFRYSKKRIQKTDSKRE